MPMQAAFIVELELDLCYMLAPDAEVFDPPASPPTLRRPRAAEWAEDDPGPGAG